MIGCSPFPWVTSIGTVTSVPGDSAKEHFTSTYPLYGILLPFAAVTSRPFSPRSNVVMGKTGNPGSWRFSQPCDTSETWAPVSHKHVAFLQFRRHVTSHFRPSSFIIAACRLGVKWLANIVSSGFSSLCDFSWSFLIA